MNGLRLPLQQSGSRHVHRIRSRNGSVRHSHFHEKIISLYFFIIPSMLNRFKAGLVFGSFISFLHLIWAVAIAITPTGMQKFINRVIGLHFIQPTTTITQATRGKGILLIVLTFIGGCIIGMIFACLWNKFLGEKKIKIVAAKPATKAKVKKRR